MPYISLTTPEKPTVGDPSGEARRKKSRRIFRHPIRSRIIGILRDGDPRTQQEMGKILAMSNAAIHYHVKLLLEVGVIKLHGTRVGPNGIVEKLYTVSVEEWPDVSVDDLDYYLDYTVSWMNERHREGVSILKGEKYQRPFLAGSYSARASLAEIVRFKRQVENIFNEFFDRCEETPVAGTVPIAVTFSLLPSLEIHDGDCRHVLEFEPKYARATGKER